MVRRCAIVGCVTMRVVRMPGIHHDSNSVLLEGNISAMLVDTGTSWYQLLQLERIKTQLKSKKELEGILLTSRRYSNSGAASFLSNEFSEAPVYIHSKGVGPLGAGDFFTTWASRFDSDMPPTKTAPIVDGDEWKLGNLTVQAIELPGYCIDSVGYYIVEKKTLVTGWTLPDANFPARWDLPTGNLINLVSSFEKILDLKLQSLIPGFGTTINGLDNVETVLNKHLKFFTECVERGGLPPIEWDKPAVTCSYLTPKIPWDQ